jgi:protein arginine kinase activator
MLCEECKVNKATVHITKIVNNQKTQMHLCEECAKQKNVGFSIGVNPFGENEPGISLGQLLSSFFEKPEQGIIDKSRELKCDRCEQTFPRFTQTGRFGCSHCYDAFKGQLDPMLRRIHGKTHHVGKVPQRSGNQIRLRNEIARLKRELQEAINAEEYERAAVLRDRIKNLEQSNNKE